MLELRKHEPSTGKKKDALLVKFVSFLGEQGVPVRDRDYAQVLGSVTPSDVVLFLSSKDASSRTVVHSEECEYWGQQLSKRVARSLCDCPARASVKSLDTFRGQLQAVFRDAGFGERWNPQKGSGNPCKAPAVDNFIKLSGREQAAAGVRQIQSALVGADMYRGMVLLWRKAGVLLHREDKILTAAEVARDCFFVSLLWHSGLRAADALRLTVQQLSVLPADHPQCGALVIQVGVAKTASKPSHAHGLIVPPSAVSDPGCLLNCLARYKSALSHLGLTLVSGRLFRTIIHVEEDNRCEWGSPMEWRECHFRFRAWCGFWAIPPLVSLHSFHGSRAAREAQLGVPREETCKNMRWTLDSYAHYVDGRSPLSVVAGDWSPPPALGPLASWSKISGMDEAFHFTPMDILNASHVWLGMASSRRGRPPARLGGAKRKSASRVVAGRGGSTRRFKTSRRPADDPRDESDQSYSGDSESVPRSEGSNGESPEESVDDADLD